MRAYWWSKLATLLLVAMGALSHTAHAIETKATHAVILDHTTGTTLYGKQQHAPMYPASMTKMMTAYMMFGALRSGDLLLDDQYLVSEKAWRKGGSKMFVQLDTDITVENLLRGIVIQSGNDACIVFSEGFAGSEERFAERMTKKARDIGMSNTTFKNATGWPDEDHVTTAYDLALLAMRTVRDFPEYYAVYGEEQFTYNGISQRNRNLLLSRNIGVDGLKTGHTEAAGYGITISGEKDGQRVHVVVGGLTSEKERAAEALKLYRIAYADFARVKGNSERVIGNVPIWYGRNHQVSVAIAPNAIAIIPEFDTESLQLDLVYDVALKAPIHKGDAIGVLRIRHPSMSEQMVDIVAADNVASASYFKQLVTNLQSLF